MGSHPLNLALRFILELSAFVSMGVWGWNQGSDWDRYFLALGIPLLFAILWGIFAVPDDPSRSGATRIKTPGVIRLFFELGIFAFGTWTLFDLGFTNISYWFGGVVILHYLISYDRIKWLLSR